MAIRAVILDVDGTLVDSNDAHARAWVDALAEHGYQVPYERIRGLVGMGGDNLLPEATGIAKESDQGRQISERRSEIFRARYLSGITPTPGAQALVQHMRAQGLRLVVASSAQEDELKPLLEAAGVPDLANEATSAEQAESSKPDPDIVQVALDNLGYLPDEVLMIGDTPYDIEAAARTGIKVVAVRSGGFSDSDLAAAIAIYDDPADLLAHFEQSPLAG
jgi:HAD superfamily hydrolase (TIGR01509 family)